LGRGGSDLTASILGAALNAGEIQVWKDVDGMLTWDPRLRAGAHRVTALSYEEAAALAHAGATVLHPETMEPARRLRIPIVIRNTFRPEVEGTRIHTGSRVITGVVKSMACRQNATVLEMRFSDSTDSQPAAAMQLFQKESSFRPLAASAGALHLEVPAEIPDPCNRFQHFGCAQIHVRTNHTIVTLVGEGVTATFVERHLSTYLRQIDAVLLPQNAGTCAVRILVPQHEFPRFAETCRRIFFAELDPRCFAEAEAPSAALHGHSQDALAQPATINRPAHANRPVAQIRPLLSAS
jgi:aspartokinase